MEEKKVVEFQEEQAIPWDEDREEKIPIFWADEMDCLLWTLRSIYDDPPSYGDGEEARRRTRKLLAKLHLMEKRLQELRRYALALRRFTVFRNPEPKLLQMVED